MTGLLRPDDSRRNGMTNSQGETCCMARPPAGSSAGKSIRHPFSRQMTIAGLVFVGAMVVSSAIVGLKPASAQSVPAQSVPAQAIQAQPIQVQPHAGVAFAPQGTIIACLKPHIPQCMGDGTTFVSADRMSGCQFEVKEYVDRTMSYLHCLNDENRKTGEELTRNVDGFNCRLSGGRSCP